MVPNKRKLAYLLRNIKQATRSYKISKGSKYETTGISACIQVLKALKHIISIKFLLFICMSSTLTLLLLHYAKHDQYAITKSQIQPKIRYKSKVFFKNFKFILLWTPQSYAPLNFFDEGHTTFVKSNCSVITCYVTTNKMLLGENLSNFDAIVFNGRNLNAKDLPRDRSPHQKYIYLNMESADNYPVCEKQFDGFFNWTATYRLNSDIPFPYILIRDNKGRIIGPKQKMKWKKYMGIVANEFDDTLENKTLAAAWFVSRCETRNDRLDYVKALNLALKLYEHKVDVFGSCGDLRCTKYDISYCNLLVKNEYYFYMSMENSFDEDYVTEKLLTALQNDAVPIVYGGANYTRFLPLGSYIDARNKSVIELAAMIDDLILYTEEYKQYFRWKHHYSYHGSMDFNVCSLCKALNDKKMFEKTTIYKDFRLWWHPNFENRCGENDTAPGKSDNNYEKLFLIY